MRPSSEIGCTSGGGFRSRAKLSFNLLCYEGEKPVFSYYQQRELHLDERYLQGKRVIFDSLILGLASPQQIQQWTQRQLPNGSR